MNLSRRELLMLGLSGATGMIGGVISSSLKNFNFNDYEINFEVNIFSNENKEKAKKQLPENLEYLAETGAYTEISVSRGYFSDEIKIYRNYSELNKDKYQKIFIERIQNKEKFSIVVTSPSIGGTKEYIKNYSFLDNNSILEIVNFGVMAEFTNSIKLYREYDKKFFYLRYDEYKPNSLERYDKTLPPKDVIFKLRDDNVIYKIYGLEALTNNDQEKLKREWLIKMSALSKA